MFIMKKLLLIAAIVGVALAGCSKDKDVLPKGNGTESSPYLIHNAAQLKALANEVNAGNDKSGVYYKLAANINLSAYSTGEGWTPIGSYPNAFSGNFDGGGYIVSNLKITINASNKGLFGYITDGVVKNLGVKGSVNTAGTHDAYSTGGIAGVITGTTKIEHCYWMGDVSGDSFVGGIVGNVGGNFSGGQVAHCYATGVISGKSQVGGIAGSNDGSVTWCVALNEKILRTGTYPYYLFGRVVGVTGTTSTLGNNVAWNNMELPDGITATSDLNGTHGMSVAYGLITQASSYELYCPTPPWTRANGKLPGLGGKTEDMPVYIY